jgi:hypothetical protein
MLAETLPCGRYRAVSLVDYAAWNSRAERLSA